MKTNIFRIGKKSLSLIIVMMLIISTMLVGMVSVNATITGYSAIYLTPNTNWRDAGAIFKLEADGTKYDFVCVDETNHVYKATLNSSSSYNNLKFLRINPDDTSKTWDSSNTFSWIDSDTTKNNYVMNEGLWSDWNVDSNGTWQAYDGGSSPSTTYYLGGRIKQTDNDSAWLDSSHTEYPFVATETPGLYKYVSSQTAAVWSENRNDLPQYFFVHTGSGKPWYGSQPDTDGDAAALTAANQSISLKEYTSGTDVTRLTYINSNDTTGNVIFYLDTNNGMSLYYEIEGGSSTIDGQYTINDKTPINGSASSAADGKTAGTADEGDAVNVTVTPNAGFDCTGITVTGADGTAIAATGSGNSYTFTMPAQNVTVSASFVLNKVSYIASQGDGLWIDVAPNETDTTATLIKWNNYKGKEHSTTNPYTFYVPKNVDLTNAYIYNGFGSSVTIGGKTINSDNYSNGVNLTVGNNAVTGAYTGNVKVMQGSTDAMFLYTSKKGADYSLPTQTGAGASKGDVKADGGVCKTMTNDASTASFSSAIAIDSVKGRGNSSWEASNTLFGKYAYNMKLADKTNLFGMATDTKKGAGSKSWCLLANNADESMLRNALTYQLAAEIGLYSSPEFRFVDIYDNGEYHGSYLVTEKVDVGTSKLVYGESFEDLNETAAITVDETTVDGTYSYNNNDYEMRYAKVASDGNTSSYEYNTTGTYLLEFEIAERYKDEASYFTSPKGQHVVVKSPEFATKEQVEFIAKKFAIMEDKAFTSGATKDDLSTVMDVESFAKMYLIQEISSNLDAASTSYYLTFDCSKTSPVFVASPVWDYDWAYGQYINNSKKAVDGSLLRTNDPEAWVAKFKAMDDSKDSTKGYSIQSQLASQNSDFKSEIRKAWEGTKGFYSKLQTYYSDGGKIDTWYNAISSSVDMNETRWGFINDNNISSWGSANTGDTHQAAVNYLKNDWTATRAAWLNTQFTNNAEYPEFVPSAPTAKAYAADGNTEISSVEAGSAFVIKAASSDSGVVYRLYKDGVQVGTDQSDGTFEITTDESMIGSTLTYTVKAVFNGKESVDSNSVSVTVGEKAGMKTVRIWFKSSSATAYVPSFAIDNGTAAVMSRDKKTTNDDGSTDYGTYFGETFSGSMKFYWYYKDVKLDTSVAHKISFTTRGYRVNATDTYTFGAEDNYYFAVNNIMSDSKLIDLTGKAEYIRNYHISATHMVFSEVTDQGVGFTWVNNTEYPMGTYLEENNVAPASLNTLTSATNLLTIPSALTPTAMLKASATPAFFTVKSATLAQKISAEISQVSELQYQLLDVNLDGVVDVRDSTMMQKALVYA